NTSELSMAMLMQQERLLMRSVIGAPVSLERLCLSTSTTESPSSDAMRVRRIEQDIAPYRHAPTPAAFP
ncbi:MAG: hypothetical protein QOE31_1645, partial [Solirubrobacteraceae bacterium]|nr:hypothetical protein [Solirubrobacteraceae bacterium]